MFIIQPANSSKVKGNIDTFKNFSNELLSSDFEDKLKKTARDPYGVFGEYVIKIVKPILQISGKKSFGGSLETYKVVNRIYTMTRYFGLASIFYTIAPGDINNPTSFRLTQRFCNNDKYPS